MKKDKEKLVRHRSPPWPVRLWRRHGKKLFCLATGYALMRLAITHTFVGQLDPMLLVQIGFAFLMQIGQIIMYFGFFFMYLGGRIRSKLYKPGDLKWTWEDYVGSKPVVERAKVIVDELVTKRAAGKLGGIRPRHVCFHGQPGTGKSYLATVIAAMAGVPVLSVEAASLLGTFIGIGPLKVWNLFRKINKLAHTWGGAILFIDEIDAWGSGRAGAAGGGTFSLLGGNMGGQILSTFLQCMSGLNEPHGLGHRLRQFLRDNFGIPYQWRPPNTLVIVSTNIDLAMLDQALFRSGRIEQKIKIGLPNRADIFALVDYYLHQRKYDYGIVGVPHDESCEVKSMARLALGCSQADIERAINDAKSLANRERVEQISFRHWMDAVIEATVGLKQPQPLTERDQELLAIHEGGHTLAALVIGEPQEVVLATIEMYGDAMGHIRPRPVGEHILSTGGELEAALMVSLASLAAEEVLGQRTPGTSVDLDKVKYLTNLLISQGMIGNPWMIKPVKETGGRTIGVALPIAELSEEGHRLATAYYEFRLAEMKDVLNENQEAMNTLVELLKQEKTVYHDEIMDAVGDLIVPHELRPFVWEPKIEGGENE